MRVLSTRKNTEYGNLRTRTQRTSRCMMGKSFGVCGGECDGAIDLLDEGSTETGAAFFVPDCGFIEFMARRRSEANLKRHLSMRLVIDAFTSFQGTTS
jgi:hypothetical protein